MTRPRCKTCVFWAVEGRSGTYGADTAEICQLMSAPNVNVPASARVQQIHDSPVSTGPDFGCIHHAERV